MFIGPFYFTTQPNTIMLNQRKLVEYLSTGTQINEAYKLYRGFN